MKYDREKLSDIFKADSEDELVLPDFQRDFVWTLEKQSNLLASVLVKLPIGSVLIIKGNKEDFPARRLGFIETTSPKEQCKFLLDGQQRLSCLKSIFDDLYSVPSSWKDVWSKLYGKLRNRWFLRLSPSDNSTEDIFGWKKLQFTNNLDQYDPEQVLDFIVSYKILVKGETDNEWYHPAYKYLDSSNNEITDYAQKRNYLANKYAEKKLVPLFEIHSNKSPNSLHNLSLRKIANYRREILQAEVRDNKFSIEEILGHINPNIASLTDEDEIDSIWRELSSDWAKNIQKALEELLEQEILETVLPSNEIARAASIFETINEGGTPLSNFDLIVAKTAKAGGKSLVQILKDYIEEEISIPDSICSSTAQWRMSDMKTIKDNSIVRFVTDQFLNLISIICYQEQLGSIDRITVEHIKQKKILNLDSQQINNNFKRTIKSLRKAFAFLQYRCGIVEANDLGYKLMLLPIAYIFSLSENNDDDIDSTLTKSSHSEQENLETVWNSKKLINKIEYWYWSSLFSGRYKNNQNERCIQDLQYLYHWVINDSTNIDEEYKNKIQDHFTLLSQNIFDKPEYSDQATLLMENDDIFPQKGIKYAILQYILSNQPKDFILQASSPNATSIQKLKACEIAKNNKTIEEHHIIPLGSATSIEESTKIIRSNKNHLLNSPLNLTYISKEANRNISDLSPNIYLNKLSAATLTKHEISPSLIELLKEIPEEFEQTYYQSILEERFKTLKRTIQTELESLID